MMPAIERTVELEAELLDDCAQGDAAAWRTLHRRYLPVATAFLRRLGVRDHNLEDATQEVFVQLLRYLPTFRREAELSTWLYRLCITQAERTRRKARVSGVLARVLSLAPGSALVSTPSLPEDVARERVEQALATLSTTERLVFVLYEMQGLPGKDIARIVDAPEASVWRRLHYARQKFCRALESR